MLAPADLHATHLNHPCSGIARTKERVKNNFPVLPGNHHAERDGYILGNHHAELDGYLANS